MTTRSPFSPQGVRSRSRPRRPTLVATAALAGLLGPITTGVVPTAAAAAVAAGVPAAVAHQQAAPTTTTTVASATTTTVASASTTTVASAATTTTTSGNTTTTPSVATTTTTVPAWTATVPGPPPPPAVVASPADIAKADQLEQQITTQSEVLDVLAGQYDADQEKVATITAQVQQLTAQLATTQAQARADQVAVTRLSQNLRQVAVDAYVDLQSGTPNGASALLGAYEDGVGHADVETALDKALTELRQLHRDEQQLQAAETAISDEEQQAATAQAAAQAAAAQAQAAAQNATGQQAQLLGLVSQDSGTLAPLVAAARDAEAQAAFQRFSAANTLQFSPSSNLGPPLLQAADVVKQAEAQIGKPYQWGATGPGSFDCSGLTMWSWAQVGVSIPRVAAQQQAWATAVPITQLQPGDLVFFGSPAYHVGIYVGDGLMVDAPHTGADVSVSPIWWDDLAGFGRVHVP